MRLAEAHRPVHAATVALDQDTTIDASNSYPEPAPNADPLTLEIIDRLGGSPTVDLVAGGVIGGFVNVRGGSHLSMSDGQIQALTTILDHASFTLRGGSIEPLIAFYNAADPAGVLRVTDNGTINLQGGQFFGTLIQEGSSVVNIFGRSFIVDGEIPNGTTSPSGVRVQGIFGNGNPFDITIMREGLNAQVFLHTIPEPPSMIPVATSAALWSAKCFRRRFLAGRRGKSCFKFDCATF